MNVTALLNSTIHRNSLNSDIYTIRFENNFIQRPSFIFYNCHKNSKFKYVEFEWKFYRVFRVRQVLI